MIDNIKEKLAPSNLEGTTLSQRARVFLAEHGIGPFFTRAAVWAERDEARGLHDPRPIGKVPPKELAKFSDRLFATKGQDAKYALLAEPVPESFTSKDSTHRTVWFDVIPKLTSPHIVHSIGQAASELAGGDTKRWKHALDLGSGTGNLEAILLGKTDVPRSVERITGVDKVIPLLSVAADRYKNDANHIAGDVTRLPFKDASFDLIVSGGLVGLLEPPDRDKYFTEVSRLLTPGGVYLDGDYQDPNNNPDNKIYNAKWILGNLIWGEVSEKPYIEPEDAIHDNVNYFSQFGLQYSSRVYPGDRPSGGVDIRILQRGIT